MNEPLRRLLAGGISLSLLVVVSACGGGEDGTIAVTPTRLNGTAAKGVVGLAAVLVCRIVNGVPEPDTSCIAGASGTDGSFSVALADGHSGPALVEVIANGSSVMLDETTGAGIRYETTMRSIVPGLSAATVTYATPFSDMVVRFMDTTVLDAEHITLASGQTTTLLAILGIDFAAKPIIDLQAGATDPVALGRKANMVKQLARVMMAAKASDMITDFHGVPCHATDASVPRQVACTTEAMSRAMTGGGLAAPGKVSRVLQALLAQNPTAVTMPVIEPDGTLVMETADMTSGPSLQSAMERAGMAPSAAASTVQAMMRGMH